MTGLAVAPDLVGISLATTVEFKTGTSVDEKNLALSSAAAATENYVNNLAVGQTLVVNEIADRIRNADPKILDLGEVNREISEISSGARDRIALGSADSWSLIFSQV